MNYFITGTGTNVGKTYLATNLLKEYKRLKRKVRGLKPIVTGVNFENIDLSIEEQSDSVLFLEAMGLEITKKNLVKISPFYYETPISPNIAVKIENKTEINYNKLLNLVLDFFKEDDDNIVQILEGIGGAMVPINETHLIADLIYNVQEQVKIKTILVTNNYLGSISHTLSTIFAMQSQKIRIEYIVLNNYGEEFISNNEFKKTLETFINIPILTMEESLEIL